MRLVNKGKNLRIGPPLPKCSGMQPGCISWAASTSQSLNSCSRSRQRRPRRLRNGSASALLPLRAVGSQTRTPRSEHAIRDPAHVRRWRRGAPRLQGLDELPAQRLGLRHRDEVGRDQQTLLHGQGVGEGAVEEDEAPLSPIRISGRNQAVLDEQEPGTVGICFTANRRVRARPLR